MGVSEIETLRGLVDSSLRSPDYGIVNFHHLHKVLHGILTHLGLHYDGKELSSNEQKITDTERHFDSSAANDSKSVENRVDSSGDLEKSSENNVYGQEGTIKEYVYDTRRETPKEVNPEDQEVEKLLSHLESKISNLEDKLKLLDDFPSNKTIIQEAQQSNPSSDTKESTLSGIWQFMKINRRLQAADDAIERIMSILHEFLGSGQGKSLSAISDSIQDLSSELQLLKDSLNNSASKFDGLLKKDDLNRFINGLATKNELKEYVKWPALEEALQIKKDKSSKEDPGNEANIIRLDEEKDVTKEKVEERPKSTPVPPTQTPVLLPEVPKTAVVTEISQSKDKNVICHDEKNEGEKILLDDDEIKNTHPSPEIVECLRRISELHDEHNKMNEVIATKMDKADLVIPPNLQSQLDELRKALSDLETIVKNGARKHTAVHEIENVALDNKDKIDSLRRELAALSRQAKQAYIERPPAAPTIDNEALLAIQRKLTDLESNQNSSKNSTEQKLAELLENLRDNQNLIETLYKQLQTLNDIKADKENVAIEMDYKADKAALDNKVNTTTFDSTFTMLDEGLREALQKMDDYLNEEMALKNALKQLSCDMKEKMDNEALKAMQNYLEKRIADLQKSRTIIAREANVDLNNAAGLRRPLPVNFHCISCNRPVDVKYNRSIEPSLPRADSIHIKKSKGPYLSYEIDQLRHLNRAQQLRPDHKLTGDSVLTSRPCGGSHTVTNQQLRKPTRIHKAQATYSVNGSSREEPVMYPNWNREVSIIDFLKGTDGHLYKGRYRTIPPIPNGKRHKHTPSESDLPPLRNPSPPLTGHKWSSEPELSRTRGVVELGDGNQSTYINTSKPLTPPTATNAAPPNSRYKNVFNQRASEMGSSAIPSPSPPTARENEYQRRIDREEFLSKQQEELAAAERLFSPRKDCRADFQTVTNENDNTGEPVQKIYTPTSKLTRPSKSGRKGANVIGSFDLTKRQMSVDSVDDVIS